MNSAGHDLAGHTTLSFSIGPIQTFIEASRSLRDLTTASALLSYLVRSAMAPVERAAGAKAFVFPAEAAVAKDDPRGTPDTFFAILPPDVDAVKVGRECVDSARNAWREIAADVRQLLHAKISSDYPGWDRLWEAQIDSYFDFRIATCPVPSNDDSLLESLLGDGVKRLTDWQCLFELSGRVMQARRAANLPTDYTPAPDESGHFPSKCSLLGTLEQMGPADFQRAVDFWNDAREHWTQAGARLRKNERLCAVSLVKRFAIATKFKDQVGLHRTDPNRGDTATIAAARWLEDAHITPSHYRDWSGQWLHWTKRKPDRNDDDEAIPEDLFDAIRSKRKETPVPAYYAILAMDGDRMGAAIRGAKTRVAHSEISSKLLEYAVTDAPKIVEQDHKGVLVYAGGDDVLALLPIEDALKCARALCTTYRARMLGDFTASAGIAVVHYKEDLRFALTEARKAEMAAKSAGRNCVTLRICRRSGEHSGVTLTWDLVDVVAGWVEGFKSTSDRWVYHLRAESETIKALPASAQVSELKRQIRRAEKPVAEVFDETRLASVLDGFRKLIGESSYEAQFPAFIAALQAASFLARGRDR